MPLSNAGNDWPQPQQARMVNEMPVANITDGTNKGRVGKRKMSDCL
jgi:hypothetical protein